MNKPKLTIIDGSSLIYSACYNSSVKEDTSDDFSTYREALDYYINSVLDETQADYYIIFGDSYTSYRKKLFKSFKADRKNKAHLKFQQDLTQYAKDEWKFFTHNELEADDLCLITNNKYKSSHIVTIASKDSDLRQVEGLFFNYGWRQPLYKKYGNDIPEEIRKEAFNKAFEIINDREADLNLWKQVLTKGHNNKIDYLEGCGEQTASNYLKDTVVMKQGRFAALSAFISGIAINKDRGIKRNVKGYGLNKGIDKFNKAFKQSYLFRTIDELTDLDIELELPELIQANLDSNLDF